jgi:hypothetical protein
MTAQGSSHVIDSKEASAALSDINAMVARVRQSRIYDLASRFMVIAGVFVTAGNLVNYVTPRHGAYIWLAINLLTLASSIAISVASRQRHGVDSFDGRVLAAFLLFYGFGLLCTGLLGHFGPRETGTFWPIYFMLFYCIAGLWFGRAFIAVGLAITVLTLIGYFFVTGDILLIWMAVVNGGGLILSGLWMRWGE